MSDIWMLEKLKDSLEELDMLQGAENLNDLTDVYLSSPSGEQILKYNASNTRWENTTVSLTGHQYHDRGDPDSYDFVKEDLIANQAWHDLDLSSIVPEGTILVHIRVRVCTPSLAGVQFRKKGNANTINVSMLKTQVANVYYYEEIFVACDSNRVIQYLAGPVSWTKLDITIRGWVK